MKTYPLPNPPSSEAAVLQPTILQRAARRVTHRLGIAAIGLAALSILDIANAGTGAAWNAPASAATKKNPLSGKADAPVAGKQLFNTNCVPCHGPAGHGNGPAAAALNPKPADFSASQHAGESDGALFWKLSEGHTPMPAFKGSLSETQRWQLVTYIRTLQGKK